MADNVVWSERGELPGVVGLHDCTYCANLMVLVAAGKRTFPLGINTAAEREALERSDFEPDRIGARHDITDVAIRRRYGVLMRKLQDGSREGLKRALSTPGSAYAVAGECGDLPEGVRVTDCFGPHDVCVIPQGGGKVLWLDPMRKMGFAGQVVDVNVVLDYAFIPNDARFLQIGELVEEDEQLIDPNRHFPVAMCKVAGGGTWCMPIRIGARCSFSDGSGRTRLACTPTSAARLARLRPSCRSESRSAGSCTSAGSGRTR